MIKTAEFSATIFNIQHGGPGDYRLPGSPGLVARGCQYVNSDLIGLNEVDANLARSGYVNLAEFAASAADMDCCFAPSGTFRGRGQVGNALLVKGRILDHSDIKLRGDRHTFKFRGHEYKLTNMPRNILIARVAIAAGELTPAVLHISGQRPEMIDRAAEAVLEWPGPHMILGDFNLPWHRVQDRLTPYGFEVVRAEGVSSDHIAIKGLQAINVTRFPLEPEFDFSDHDPIRGEYAFTNANRIEILP